jgi:hypothetical protein
MIDRVSSSNFNSRLASSSSRSNTLFFQRLEHDSLQKSTSFSTRSQREIGTFNRVCSSSGSVRRQFDNVFRFNLTKRRVGIYWRNQSFNLRSNNRSIGGAN